MKLRRNIPTAALFLIVLLLIGCDSRSTQTASSGKSQTSSEAQTSSKTIDPKTYDGPLFPAIKDGKYGFINTTGSFVIPPIFTFAKEFSEGLAAVYVGGRSYIKQFESSQYIDYEDGKWGFIDRTGTIKIPAQFGDVQQFSDGLALVAIGSGREGKAGYIDVNGLYKIAPKFDFFSSTPFKNGVAAVRLAKLTPPKMVPGVGFVDSSGNKLSPTEALSIAREYATLMNGYWIDTSGKAIDDLHALGMLGVEGITFEKKEPVQIHGVRVEGTKYGIRDNKGKVVVKPQFDRLGEFYGKRNLKKYNFADACTASKWSIPGVLMDEAKCGLVDIRGNIVAPFDFDTVSMATDDLAVFAVGCEGWLKCSAGKYGVFSAKEKRIVINPQYDQVYVGDDLILVRESSKWGYIDFSGKVVIEPQFRTVRPFKDGLAQADFPPSYIDRSGKYIYKGTIGTLQPKPKDASAPTPSIASRTAPVGGTPTKKGSGTVFVVNKDGFAVTNNHVVDGCTELRIEGREGPVKRVTEDAVNDLAVIKLSGDFQSSAAVASDPTKLRQGEDIVVFGFPLNTVLSSGGNLTPGVVSALTGLGNNTNQIQITAPIQPGSSGSPVINRKGEVVGVVSMKLSDSKMASVTGQIGQNVNFAVSGQTLKTFLTTHKVDYRNGTSFSFFDKSTADLADEARKWTLILECWK